jgi:hypothetical protein
VLFRNHSSDSSSPAKLSTLCVRKGRKCVRDGKGQVQIYQVEPGCGESGGKHARKRAATVWKEAFGWVFFSPGSLRRGETSRYTLWWYSSMYAISSCVRRSMSIKRDCQKRVADQKEILLNVYVCRSTVCGICTIHFRGRAMDTVIDFSEMCARVIQRTLAQHEGG